MDPVPYVDCDVFVLLISIKIWFGRFHGHATKVWHKMYAMSVAGQIAFYLCFSRDPYGEEDATYRCTFWFACDQAEGDNHSGNTS